MKDNDDYIYVVLVKALTGLGGIVRTFGGYEYTHIAISFVKHKNEFITFSRRKHFAPFDAGFMRERVEHYAFGKHKRVKLKIFAIPVSHTVKQKIEDFVKSIEADREYVFNIISMITMPVLNGVDIYKSYNCMSFAGHIISMTGVVDMSRPYYKYDIKAIDELLKEYFLKEGYVTKKKEDKDYMKHYGVCYNIKCFADLITELIHRKIFMGK